MGSMNKESSFKLLDAYYDAGGNFIDTANAYQDESSEEFMCEWAEKRGIRDQLVIRYQILGEFQTLIALRCVGWGYDASVEEVMNSLHGLVMAGKVLYLDAPAWVAAKANQWARDHGKTPFSIYQGKWSILDRTFERDIIPMARSEGLALAPWAVLSSGRFRTDEEEKRRKESGEHGRKTAGPNWERTPTEVKVSHKLEEIAKEVGAKHITFVAICNMPLVLNP
ncbi:Aldo/keto reductase [Ramaria rubella]|nr:Aldo/keto reductase [Ramaria rubella]